MSLDKGSTDPSQLTEGGGTDAEDLKPREFFWDSIIIYLVSVILALSAIDALTEYIRGTGVSCITNEGLGDGVLDYINNYCTGSLPVTEYIPAFIFIHGLAVSIPHFLWLATYGGQFDYFFSVIKNLDNFRDETTGRYPKNSIDLVRQLELSFTTYGRNSIFWLYVGKLLLQLVFALASLVVAVFYFTDFEVFFRCPRNNNTMDEFWPLLTDVTCVFTSLKLLYWIRIADVALICLIVCSLLWGFWFCISGHPTELGADSVARFSFQSGIHPVFYVPHCWYSPRRISGFLVRFVSLPFTSPRISTDLDFMILKLFRTNSGFGKVVKDIQIELRTMTITEQDRLVVSLLERKWRSGVEVDIPEDDLKWNFESLPTELFDNPTQRNFLQVPNTVRGAILGLSTLSTGTGALSITFNNAGHGLALSRLFERTADIIFTDHKKGMEVDNNRKPEDIAKDMVEVVSNTASYVTVSVPEDLLVAREEYSSEFYNQIQPVWMPDCDNDDDRIKTSFVVVGPMNEDQSTIMNLFLNQICSDNLQLEDGCVIVIMRPITIAGKGTGKEFHGLQRKNKEKKFHNKSPLKQIIPPNCTPLNIGIVVSKQELSWPSDLNPPESKQHRNVSRPSAPKQDAVFATLEEKTDEQEMTVAIPLTDTRIIGSNDDTESSTDKPPVTPSLVHLMCGDIDTCFEVCIYKWKKDDETSSESSEDSGSATSLPKVLNKD